MARRHSSKMWPSLDIRRLASRSRHSPTDFRASTISPDPAAFCFVCIYVARQISKPELTRLRAEYDAAFATWSREVSSANQRTPQSAAMNETLSSNANPRVIEAQEIYRKTRDRLVRWLLASRQARRNRGVAA